MVFSPMKYKVHIATALLAFYVCKSFADPKYFQDCPECPVMTEIPSGEFIMGSPLEEKGQVFETPGTRREEPPHRVKIDYSFAIGKYEVTRKEYSRFSVATNKSEINNCKAWTRNADSFSANWKNPKYKQTDDHPTVCVSWDDAISYVQWLSKLTGRKYRLPSESEWEYVARSESQTPYPWGSSSSDACRYANVADKSIRNAKGGIPNTLHKCDDQFSYTSPVGSFAPNRFGVHDMIGNAWEWTADCWRYPVGYWGAPNDGSPWERQYSTAPISIQGDSAHYRSKPECNLRVLRGGSWNMPPLQTRSAYRIWDHSERPYFTYGFRVIGELR